ncbi:MAG: lipocalin-like domain-containing protein [Symploca sp. SIO1C2]|nr:lipocalin-like domain-containing protein [Symploca sp. SIO1C2]
MEFGNLFVGTWILMSWEAQTAEGKTIYPFGEDATGWLMYDGEGNMSVNLMRRNRPKFSTDDPSGGTVEEIKGAYKGYLAYCGRYTIQEENLTITHSLDCALFPNWVGSLQLRHFEFSEDRLTLTLSTPPIAGKSHMLVWRKK